jgi:hypothetical protein
MDVVKPASAMKVAFVNDGCYCFSLKWNGINLQMRKLYHNIVVYFISSNTHQDLVIYDGTRQTILFESLLYFAGLLHVCDNSHADAKSKLKRYDEWYNMLRDLVAYFRNRKSREDYVNGCLSTGPNTVFRSQFEKKSPFKVKLIEGRWLVAVASAKEAKILKAVLKHTYDYRKMSPPPSSEAANRNQDEEWSVSSPREVHDIIHSSFFWAYTDAVILMNALPEKLKARVSSCKCHPSEAAGIPEEMHSSIHTRNDM